MVRAIVLLSAAAGYFLVVWFFVVSPYYMLQTDSLVCPLCPVYVSIGPTWPIYLLIYGPINAAMYGGIGFLLCKLFLVIKSRWRRRSTS